MMLSLRVSFVNHVTCAVRCGREVSLSMPLQGNCFADETLKQCGLPACCWTEHHGDLSGLDFEVDGFEDCWTAHAPRETLVREGDYMA